MATDNSTEINPEIADINFLVLIDAPSILPESSSDCLLYALEELAKIDDGTTSPLIRVVTGTFARLLLDRRLDDLQAEDEIRAVVIRHLQESGALRVSSRSRRQCSTDKMGPNPID